jgi:DtxR family Mn-dependent transcriptional regulator
MEATVVADEPRDLSPAVEDYLRTILLLQEHSIAATPQRLREFLGLALPTISGSLKRLEREGLLYRGEKHRIHLTPLGRLAAGCVMRRNRLVERFLYDVLHVPFSDLAHEADRMEHAISPATEHHLYRLLGRPKTCPHGNPIEPDHPAQGARLASFRFGRIEIVRVLEAVATDAGFMSWVEANALMPGRRFEVVGNSSGRIAVAGKDGTIAVSRPAAELIMASFAADSIRDRGGSE